jgi:hypothetical protein
VWLGFVEGERNHKVFRDHDARCNLDFLTTILLILALQKLSKAVSSYIEIHVCVITKQAYMLPIREPFSLLHQKRMEQSVHKNCMVHIRVNERMVECERYAEADQNVEGWRVGEVVIQIAQEIGIPPMQAIVFSN